MGETGYRCPECGQTEDFRADGVWVLFMGVEITRDGWDWMRGKAVESDMHGEARMTCRACGHAGRASEFEEGE